MKDKIDILIKGGTLLTMNTEGTMYEDGAIAVDKGKIAEVGKYQTIHKKKRNGWKEVLSILQKQCFK